MTVEAADGKTLLLSHWVTNDTNVTTYYLDKTGVPHQYTGDIAEANTLVKEYTVYLPAINEGNHATEIAGLIGKTLTIKAQALKEDGSSRQPGAEGYETTASSAIIQLLEAGQTIDGKVENSTAASQTGVTFVVPQNYAGAKTAIAKIGIRADGGAITGSGNPESANSINADFYVTVTAN